MSASISAEQIQKMITGNSTEQYIGGAGGHSPILDLVNRLSGQLNQQTAESNLYRGGAGYGGSFQSADQKAARAAGETLNAKPYGGWGGYGSQNPTMTNQPLGGGGPDTYVPPWTSGTTGPALPPTDGFGSTPVGQVPTPPTTNPAPPQSPVLTPDNAPPTTMPAPPPQVFTPNPPTAPPAVTQGPVFSPVPGTPSTTTGGNPYEAFAGDGGAVPTTWGGNLKPGDPGWNPAWEGGGPSGGFGGGSGGSNLSTAPYTPPSVVTGQQNAPGNPHPQGSPQWTAWNAAMREPTAQELAQKKADVIALGGDEASFQATLQAEALARKMVAAGMDPMGGGGLNTGDIVSALRSGVPMETIEGHYMALMKEMGPTFNSASHGAFTRLDPEKLKAGTQTAETLTNALGPSYANYVPGAAPANKAGLVTDGGATGAKITSVPDVPLYNAGTTEIPDTGGGVIGGDPFYKPPPGGTDPKSPMLQKISVPGGGKNWGPRDTPPKGMKFGDYYIAGNGLRIAYTREGRYAPVNIDADGKMSYTYSTDPENNSAIPVLNTPDPRAKPVFGATAIVGYTMDGQPIYNETGLFEQGANADGVGDTTPDAWSTSPDWRPEEPTGGLYGAYTQMAGGQLTDYENAIGTKWRDLSENPATADDLDYKNLVAEYNKTPGKGIDEAYGAYNEMINSNGYSDAEKGAMEGSAVRGISTGFQRGADEIRRQGARTNNRASAYAALGNAGAAYGADLGETNRQNQIKFADEAQRRKEAGASGMTNVAGLSNTRSQFGISAAGEYAKEMARRKEAGIAGMGDFATYGRGLQSQGLAGLDKMLQQSNSDKNNTYAQIAALLGTNVGQSSGGTSKTNTTGIQAGI